jgi:hypothetical protein
MTPLTGEGISVSTLSVEISSRPSSAWIVSPTFLSQRVTVPSVTLSERGEDHGCAHDCVSFRKSDVVLA